MNGIRKIMETKKLIEPKLYQEIYENVPIACVDILITNNDKFLLAKRTCKPAQFEWWLPGGRIWKNERLADAASRKVKEEFGLEYPASDFNFLSCKETIFPDSNYGGPIHTVNIVYKIDLKEDPKINLDTASHSAYTWFEKIDGSWNPYIMELLTKAGF